MNKGLQVHTIKEKLQSAGVSPELVDVEAHVDPSLHLDENIRNMQDQGLIPLDIVPDTQQQIQHEREHGVEQQADMLHEQRSEQAQLTDEAIEAETVFEPEDLIGDEGDENFERWAEDPEEYDIEGVDHFEF